MCFSEAVVKRWGKSLATHPPIGVRILRMDPTWGGDYIVPDREPVKKVKMESDDEQLDVVDSLLEGGIVSGLAGSGGVPEEKFISTEETMNLMGTVEARHLLYAKIY